MEESLVSYEAHSLDTFARQGNAEKWVELWYPSLKIYFTPQTALRMAAIARRGTLGRVWGVELPDQVLLTLQGKAIKTETYNSRAGARAIAQRMAERSIEQRAASMVNGAATYRSVGFSMSGQRAFVQLANNEGAFAHSNGPTIEIRATPATTSERPLQAGWGDGALGTLFAGLGLGLGAGFYLGRLSKRGAQGSDVQSQQRYSSSPSCCPGPTKFGVPPVWPVVENGKPSPAPGAELPAASPGSREWRDPDEPDFSAIGHPLRRQVRPIPTEPVGTSEEMPFNRSERRPETFSSGVLTEYAPPPVESRIVGPGPVNVVAREAVLQTAGARDGRFSVIPQPKGQETRVWVVDNTPFVPGPDGYGGTILPSRLAIVDMASLRGFALEMKYGGSVDYIDMLRAAVWSDVLSGKTPNSADFYARELSPEEAATVRPFLADTGWGTGMSRKQQALEWLNDCSTKMPANPFWQTGVTVTPQTRSRRIMTRPAETEVSGVATVVPPEVLKQTSPVERHGPQIRGRLIAGRSRPQVEDQRIDEAAVPSVETSTPTPVAASKPNPSGVTDAQIHWAMDVMARMDTRPDTRSPEDIAARIEWARSDAHSALDLVGKAKLLEQRVVDIVRQPPDKSTGLFMAEAVATTWGFPANPSKWGCNSIFVLDTNEDQGMQLWPRVETPNIYHMEPFSISRDGGRIMLALESGTPDTSILHFAVRELSEGEAHEFALAKRDNTYQNWLVRKIETFPQKNPFRAVRSWYDVLPPLIPEQPQDFSEAQPASRFKGGLEGVAKAMTAFLSEGPMCKPDAEASGVATVVPPEALAEVAAVKK